MYQMNMCFSLFCFDFHLIVSVALHSQINNIFASALHIVYSILISGDYCTKPVAIAPNRDKSKIRIIYEAGRVQFLIDCIIVKVGLRCLKEARIIFINCRSGI